MSYSSTIDQKNSTKIIKANIQLFTTPQSFLNYVDFSKKLSSIKQSISNETTKYQNIKVTTSSVNKLQENNVDSKRKGQKKTLFPDIGVIVDSNKESVSNKKISKDHQNLNNKFTVDEAHKLANKIMIALLNHNKQPKSHSKNGKLKKYF